MSGVVCVHNINTFPFPLPCFFHNNFQESLAILAIVGLYCCSKVNFFGLVLNPLRHA